MFTINKKLVDKLCGLNYTKEDNIDDFKQRDGAFSQIYKVLHENQKVALKIINLDSKMTIMRHTRTFFREIVEQNLAEHPNVLKLSHWSLFYKPNKGEKTFINFSPRLATEFCEYKNLGHFLHKTIKLNAGDEKWMNTQKLILAYGIAQGMRHLHRFNIIHRDLKNPNIMIKKIDNDLLSSYFTPLIGDLGFAKIADLRTNQSQQCGTYHYLAPEAQTSTMYSFPVDVYSYAIILSNIFQLYKIPDYDGEKPPYQFIQYIQSGHRPKLGRMVTSEQRNFLAQLWCQNPKDRLKFGEIVTKLEEEPGIFGNIDENDFLEYQNYIRDAISGKEKSFRTSYVKVKYLANSNISVTNERHYQLDLQEDVHKVLELSNNGSVAACEEAALMYASGRARDTNFSKTVWYCGQFDRRLSSVLMKVPQHMSKGERLVRLGDLAEKQRNFESAEAKYKKAAKMGYVPAVGRWGALMIQCPDTETQKAGIKLIQLAAEKRDKEAMFRYAFMISRGNKELTLAKVPLTAAKWFTAAANSGHPDGWYQAAYIYHQLAIEAQKNGDKEKTLEHLKNAIGCYTNSWEKWKDETAKNMRDRLKPLVEQKT